MVEQLDQITDSMVDPATITSVEAQNAGAAGAGSKMVAVQW